MTRIENGLRVEQSKKKQDKEWPVVHDIISWMLPIEETSCICEILDEY